VRWRSAHLVSAGVCGALTWRSVALLFGYEPGVTLDLEGRPVEVTALPLGLGWQPELWTARSWRLRARLSLQAQWVQVYREGVEGAGTHHYWELGGGLGLTLWRSLGPRLRAGLGVEGHVYPLSRPVEIPAGPRRRLNLVSVLWSGQLAWELWP